MADVRPMKAVIVVLSDEVADDVARLFHGCLTMNGYGVQGMPHVIDLPLAALASEETSP